MDALATAGAPSAQALVTVEGAIKRFSRSKYPTLDPDDVSQTTLYKLVRARPMPENPVAYLYTVIKSAAVEMLRSEHPSEPLDEAWVQQRAAEHDAVAALMDREADAACIAAAIALHLQAANHQLVRTITVWLDLAHERGSAPPLREVAKFAGCSHTLVSQALDRFRVTITVVLREAG